MSDTPLQQSLNTGDIHAEGDVTLENKVTVIHSADERTCPRPFQDAPPNFSGRAKDIETLFQRNCSGV